MNTFGDLQNGNYKNPILYGDYSDPDIIRVGEDFFMVSSSFTYFPGIPVLHSKDLVNWKIISYAVNNMPYEHYNKPQHGKGTWAPSIRYHNNKFWVYFGAPDEGIFMSNTENPFGKWNDVVLVKEAKGYIDTCPFWDDDGQAYLVHAFARSRCGIKSLLMLHKMSEDGTKLLDEGTIIFDGRINHPTMEGPKIYKRNGYYYIFAPAGGVTEGWQVCLRSKSIYGPYTDKVVLQQGSTVINGPHQGGYVELENGENWFIHFQDAGPYGRITHLQPMQWIDDFPVIGNYNSVSKIGEPVITHKMPNTKGQGTFLPQQSDEFDKNELSLCWQFQSNVNKDNYSFTDKGIRLNSKPCDLLTNAENMLCQLIQNPEFEVVTKLIPTLDEGDTAGIGISGGNYYTVRLQDGFIKQVNFEYTKSDKECIIEEVQAESLKEIYFKLKITQGLNISFYYSYDGENYKEIGKKVPFKVDRRSWVGGRVSLFTNNIENKDSKGYCEFEYIRFCQG